MKKYKDFIPRSDADFSIFATGHKADFRNIVRDAIPYLPQAAIEAHEALLQSAIDAVQEVDIQKAELAAAVAKKNSAIAAATQSIRRMALLAKKSMEGPHATIVATGLKCQAIRLDPKELSPKLKARVFDGQIELAYNKHNMLAIAVYTRTPGVTDWSLLGSTDTSPFIDKRPLAVEFQPERREYRAVYTNYKESISLMSNIVSIVYGG